MMICPHCAFPNDPGVSICIKCRKSFDEAPADALAEVMKHEPVMEPTHSSSGREAYSTPQTPGEAGVFLVWVAGFWERLIALIIDLAVVTGVLGVMVALSWLMRGGGAEGAFGLFLQNPKALLALATMFLLLMGAYIAIFTRFGGQTLGQILLRLQVIHESGHELTTSQVLLRMLGIVLAALPGLAGFLWVGFDRERRGWHDHIGQSLVIRLRPHTVAHKHIVNVGDGVNHT